MFDIVWSEVHSVGYSMSIHLTRDEHEMLKIKTSEDRDETFVGLRTWPRYML